MTDATPQPDNSGGSMIALYPPPGLAAALTLPGGLPPEESHLTIAYTGKAADVDREALNAVAAALARRDPIQATISGHARFTGGEQDVHVALVDSASLEDLRRDTLDRLGAHGITIPRDHGHTAHITRAYASQDSPDPGRLDAAPVTFTAISAVHAGDRTDYPFTSDPAGHPLAPVAAEAFAIGYATTRAPITPRARAAHAAAVAEALANDDDPDIIDATLRLGHLEGTQALTDRRREELAAERIAAIMAAWNKTTSGLNARRLVSQLRHELLLQDDPGPGDDQPGDDPHRAWRRETAITAARGLLRGVWNSPAFPALLAAVTDAIRAAKAEGRAGALAQAAARQGHHGFDLAAAAAAAYDQLDGDPGLDGDAHDAITRMIDGAGTDLGGRLAALAYTGASYQDMLTAAWGLITGDQIRAVTAYTDLALWTGIGAGILDLYQSLSVEDVWWQTGGPNPCPVCKANADNSPYQPDSVPAFPPHPHCRCGLSTRTSLPTHLFAAFLTGAAVSAATSLLKGAP